MTINEIIEERFTYNLVLAREENPDMEDDEVWRFAREWTIEDMSSEIAKYIDNMWAGRQEAINQAFYK